MILDFGLGNIKSVYNWLTYNNRLNEIVVKSNNELNINNDNKYDIWILPGVGSYDKASKVIEDNRIRDNLEERYFVKKFIVGICLGAQIFLESSDESKKNSMGLGWIKGHCVKLNKEDSPAIGWYKQKAINNPKLFNCINNKYFYHNHNYSIICNEKKVVKYKTYDEDITSVILKDNIIGFQFHPEKSQKAGQKLLNQLIRIIK